MYSVMTVVLHVPEGYLLHQVHTIIKTVIDISFIRERLFFSIFLFIIINQQAINVK